MKARMRKFVFGLSNDLVSECKGKILNNDMYISRMKVYIQQVEEEKKKKEPVGERQTKRVKIVKQDTIQNQDGRWGKK